MDLKVLSVGLKYPSFALFKNSLIKQNVSRKRPFRSYLLASCGLVPERQKKKMRRKVYKTIMSYQPLTLLFSLH